MPKTKRNKVVSLTATKKKGFAEGKAALVNELRECADQYARIFVFRVDNMRNSKLKELRTEMRYSRFFFGKNKVMSIGLGRSEAEEYKEGLHQLAACLSGQCGLLFTNSSLEEITAFFSAYRQQDYARTGDIASQTVTLQAGPLTQFPHNIEPYLRELGMPTALQKGVVTLLQDFQVCRKGATLTSEQARILKLLEKKLARFEVKIDAMWSAEGGFEMLKKGGGGTSQKKKKGGGSSSDGEEEEEKRRRGGGGNVRR
ncbi:mRNA turnover 4 [Tyrophagus putrescentiae]|nr:mRNA turnover 4 [Tyrophagus putrescentiae]